MHLPIRPSYGFAAGLIRRGQAVGGYLLVGALVVAVALGGGILSNLGQQQSTETGAQVAALDDFGTGYSSLAYLSRFPFDILKIDKTFVDEASSGAPGGEALIKAIVDPGVGLNLKTVAEGIELPAQASHMKTLGCDAGQGYLFARPMPAAGFTELLAHRLPGPVTLAALSTTP